MGPRLDLIRIPTFKHPNQCPDLDGLYVVALFFFFFKNRNKD